MGRKKYQIEDHIVLIEDPSPESYSDEEWERLLEEILLMTDEERKDISCTIAP